MNNKDIERVIYISAFILVVGVFLPLAKLPIYGDVTYNKIAPIESYLLIVFALSAPILLFMYKPKLIKFSPIAVWLVLLFPAIKNLFQSKDSSFLRKIGDKISSAMQDFAADLFLNITDFSWGGFIFIVGLLVFTISCVLRSLK